MALHAEDALKGISQYNIEDRCRNNKLLFHYKHSLMQRILFVWPLCSRKEDIAADSLASAHEDVLALAFNGWLDNSKLDVHYLWLPLWLLQCDYISHNIDN